MTSQRRRVLDLFAELSEFYPDMRMGQFLTWFANAARGSTVESIYDVEDDELIAVMESHLEHRKIDATTAESQAV